MAGKSGDKRSPFFDLEPRHARKKTSRFVILPVPYERTTSYLKGCKHGPEAVRKAGSQVELYEPELAAEPYLQGIYTAPPVNFGKKSEREELARIRKAAAPYVREGKFLAAIGGEHTVSVPLVELFARKYGNLTVLQIDAHPDLRASYEGSRYSHACVGRRIIEQVPIVQVGVRSWSIEEQEFMDSIRRKKIRGRRALTLFPADKIAGKSGRQARVVEALSENVYLTIDLDGLDPAVVPSVGTPEPGGLGWRETIELLKKVIKNRRLVGMDMVELKPVKGDVRGEMAAARLLHFILACLAVYRKNP